MTIEVNYGGMAELAQAAELQRGYLRSVHSFVTGSCSNFGAFSGFMSIFAGQYRSAYTDAETSLSQSPGAAHGMASKIRTTADNFHQRDIAASDRLKAFETQISVAGLPSIGPGGPMAPGEHGPWVTREDKNIAGGAGVVIDITREGENLFNPHVPAHAWDDGPKSLNPLSPIALAGEIENAVNTTADAAGVGDDLDDYRDFERGEK
ncbi:hypothetical protein GCM10009867_33530 [Pedococcus aerophilus]|uniref:WXG100 family type VII secretion target n=1 Tax=Pedococcus aerophilus TaxID=436356 RepID=A0ABP6HCU1_9MICO